MEKNKKKRVVWREYLFFSPISVYHTFFTVNFDFLPRHLFVTYKYTLITKKCLGRHVRYRNKSFSTSNYPGLTGPIICFHSRTQSNYVSKHTKTKKREILSNITQNLSFFLFIKRNELENRKLK